MTTHREVTQLSIGGVHVPSWIIHIWGFRVGILFQEIVPYMANAFEDAETGARVDAKYSPSFRFVFGLDSVVEGKNVYVLYGFKFWRKREIH